MDRSLPKNGKLPWCPICGAPPEGDEDTFARCAMPGCPLNKAYVDAKDWRNLVYKVWKDLKDLRPLPNAPKPAEISVFLQGEGEMDAAAARDKLGLLSPFSLDTNPRFGPAVWQEEIQMLWDPQTLPKQPERIPFTPEGQLKPKGWTIQQKEAQVLINPRALQRGGMAGLLGLAEPKEDSPRPPKEKIDEWIGRLQAMKASYGTEDGEQVQDAWREKMGGDGYDDWDMQLLRIMDEED